MKFFVIFLIASFFNFEVESIKINCVFRDDMFDVYGCFVLNLTISSRDDRTITEISGSHLRGRTNEDVKSFNSGFKNVNFFPLGITKIFPNLESFDFQNSNLLEIRSSDLEQFGGNLKQIWLSGNKIEFLEENLFKFNLNLEVIDLHTNKIAYIDDGTFAGFSKLKALNLNSNPCINRSEGVSDSILIAERECKDKFVKMRVQIVTDMHAENTKMRTEMTQIKSELAHILTILNNLTTNNRKN